MFSATVVFPDKTAVYGGVRGATIMGMVQGLISFEKAVPKIVVFHCTGFMYRARHFLIIKS